MLDQEKAFKTEAKMFFPTTFPATQIAALGDTNRPIRCLCGCNVNLADCLCVWTMANGDNTPNWYAACSSHCVVVHVCGGTC